MTSLVKNAADGEQVRRAGQKERYARKERLDDMRLILATEQGRRFIWDILTQCNMFRSCFTGSSETYYLEGQRDIGLMLMADVMAAEADKYVLMAREAQTREEKQNG